MRWEPPNKAPQPLVHCILRPILQQKPEKNMKSALSFEVQFFSKGFVSFQTRDLGGGVRSSQVSKPGMRAHPDILRFGSKWGVSYCKLSKNIHSRRTAGYAPHSIPAPRRIRLRTGLRGARGLFVGHQGATQHRRPTHPHPAPRAKSPPRCGRGCQLVEMLSEFRRQSPPMYTGKKVHGSGILVPTSQGWTCGI